MATVRDLISDAYVNSGVLGLGQSIENTELSFALRQLNKLIESLSLDSLWPWTFTSATFNTVANDGVYTIGSAGDIVSARPIQIEAMQVLFGGVYYPVKEVDNVDYWNSIISTTAGGVPKFFRYQSDYPSGTIEIYPLPDQVYSLTVRYKTQISEFGINDVLALPPGYQSALEYGLASLIARLNGLNNQSLQMEYDKRIARIKRNNSEQRQASLRMLPSSSWRGGYNVYTDQFSGDLT